MSSDASLQILLIEDDDADALLLARQLKLAGISAQIERVSQLDELERALISPRWELVIADYLLPGFDGLIATARIRDVDPELPVIIVSGMAGEELAVLAMQAGAYDYLLKTRLDRLGHAVRGALARAAQARAARLATEALAESEARLRLALEAASMVVWEWDIRSDVFRWSGEGGGSLSQRSDVRSALALIHPDDAPDLQRALDACLIGEQTAFGCELRLVTSGRKGWAHVTGRIFQSADPPVWRLVGTATDITSRKALESQLLQSQNMEGLGRLAGGIAHDFNNLLTILMGYLSIAQIEAQDHPGLQEVLGPMREATESAAALTRQLLGFAGRQRLSPRRLMPDELMYEGARLFQRLLGQSILLELDVEPRCWAIKGDPSQLQQVLLTLIVNARDAMPRGGTIILRVRNHTLRAHSPELLIGPGEFVSFAVIDQGAGIEPELLTHLFEPFYNVEGQGTGLGLATAHGIITQHSGAMCASSSPGEGSAVEFWLPRYDDGRSAHSAGEDSALLLVVDEHAIIHQMISASLRGAPYRVQQARSAAQAREIAASQPPALLICDLELPDGDGAALAAHLRAAHPALRVLHTSARPSPGALHKPFSAEALLAAISAALV